MTFQVIQDAVDQALRNCWDFSSLRIYVPGYGEPRKDNSGLILTPCKLYLLPVQLSKDVGSSDRALRNWQGWTHRLKDSQVMFRGPGGKEKRLGGLTVLTTNRRRRLGLNNRNYFSRSGVWKSQIWCSLSWFLACLLSSRSHGGKRKPRCLWLCVCVDTRVWRLKDNLRRGSCILFYLVRQGL